jgi:predicted metal-binding membrane protein
MAILVAAGSMALGWVIVISAVIFAQKLLPGGELAARITGAALLALALAVAVQPELAAGLRGYGM